MSSSQIHPCPFVSHLYNSLKSEAGVAVFWDDERTTYDLIVVPLFYDGIYPSDGTSHRNLYADSDFVYRMLIGETEDKFMIWMAANSQATTYPGSIDILNKYGNESEYIKNVVEHVTRVLNKRDLFSGYTESTASRAEDVIQLLKQSTGPLVIGIWGMTGIGKSTIAKAIYEQIGPYFEDKSMFENIQGDWKKNNADRLHFTANFFNIGVSTKMKIHTIESGKVVLNEIIVQKRVLFILDNVDKLEQLDYVRRELFGKGSKLIITTRNRHLLKTPKVDCIYRVKELDESESLKVFNFDAFRQATSPGEDFGELSRQIVAYSRGLPLALGELGWFLRGKEILEWKGTLRSLERFSIPVPELLKALEKIFSDLSKQEEQLFLDIACFFIGMNQNDVLQTLNDRSTQCTTLQIGLLEDKSLLTIDENNKLQMHVLLQAMVKDIIKREPSNMTNQPKITKGLVVVPVFYEVDPSEVRHQKGEFGEKFDALLSKISVDEYTKSNWRRDLIDIGGIAGFVLIGSRLFEFSLRILFVML
ncbi:hypothetical protein P8452_30283 [Trifolium repens]|nr:hypothetical protein P8452_30283 [Trifolium repens]